MYLRIIPLNFVKLIKQLQGGIIHQPAFTCSKLTTEALEQGVESEFELSPRTLEIAK